MRCLQIYESGVVKIPVIKLGHDKGFTLIELMVVVAILSVLSTMVITGITGTQPKGEISTIKSDAATVYMAAQNFNASSRTKDWPEDNLIWMGNNAYWYTGSTIPKTFVASLGFIPSSGASQAVTSHTTLKFEKITEITQASGVVATVTFVPDFINQKPDSISKTVSTSAGVLPVYLWLLRKGSPDLEDPGRSLQVFQLNDNKDAYVRVYPPN